MIKKNQKGTFIILGALLVGFLFTVLGLMTDMAWVYSSRTQLRNAADALAVVGAKSLIQNNLSTATTTVLTDAGLFKVGEKYLTLASTDVRLGTYNTDTGVFTETSVKADTIEVTARRTAVSPSGALPLFFSPIFGNKTLELTMKAYSSISTLDLILINDTSGSMSDDTTTGGWHGTQGLPQPITAAKIAAQSFLVNLRPNYDMAGFISYCDTSTLKNTLSFNYVSVSSNIASIVANGWTNTGAAIQMAIQEFATHGRQISAKVIVILSDGQPNCKAYTGSCGDNYAYQGEQYARTQAQLAANANITIYAISLGSDANRTFMQYLASVTDGKEYYAPDGGALQGIYAQIVKDLPVKLTG